MYYIKKALQSSGLYPGICPRLYFGQSSPEFIWTVRGTPDSKVLLYPIIYHMAKHPIYSKSAQNGVHQYGIHMYISNRNGKYKVRNKCTFRLTQIISYRLSGTLDLTQVNVPAITSTCKYLQVSIGLYIYISILNIYYQYCVFVPYCIYIYRNTCGKANIIRGDWLMYIFLLQVILWIS